MRFAFLACLILSQLYCLGWCQEHSFLDDVRPILSEHCYACHGPDRQARVTDLRLDSRESAVATAVLTSGEMLDRLETSDPDLQMPPAGERPLPSQERQILIEWLRTGARWPANDQHWAFTPPVRPDLPPVANTTWAQNPIDLFVLAKQEQEQVQPSPRADKETLLRRLSFDLTGLPPSLDALDEYLENPREESTEQAIEQLLQSPQFGEHMAIDWLEGAHYADTDGYQNDRLRTMWVWRDWVINALNQNLPFDKFVQHQVAGDLIADRNFKTQVATGFFRNHRINSEAGSIPDEWKVEYVADRVDTLGTMLLGVTLSCARCHDHKFDPISQTDYYQLFAFFNNIAEAGLGPNNGNSPPFVQVPESWPHLSEEDLNFVTPDKVKIKIVQGAVPRPQPGSDKTVMVLHESDELSETFLLERGQYDRPVKSQTLAPATPSKLGVWESQWPRNRIGLARWLTHPNNPLLARVIMNRMWQHYFGTGLVRTSENFGLQGEFPSHPRLLDWLATELIRQDWDIKAMHKLIVTSATYQQSAHGQVSPEKDPDNRLLTRGPRRRLSPFAIRDAVLYQSQLLDSQIGGPSVKPYMPPGIWKSISNAKYSQDKGKNLYRRSLYTYWRRTVPPPTMMAFNAASRETCIVRNDTTTTPLQALTLLNNVTFVEAAKVMAQQMLNRSTETPRQRITWAFRVVTSRFPNAAELDIIEKDLEQFETEFHANPNAAKELLKVGEFVLDSKTPPHQLAAYTMIANTICNLDEAISVN